MASYALIDDERVRWTQLAELSRRFGLSTHTRAAYTAHHNALSTSLDQLLTENVPSGAQLVANLHEEWKTRRIEYEDELVAAYTRTRLWSFFFGAATVGFVVLLGMTIGRHARRR